MNAKMTAKMTAAMLVTSFGFAGAAHAGNQNLGVLSMGDNYFQTNVTNTISNGNNLGFEDLWTFQTPSSTNLGADVIANFSFTGFNANITKLELMTPAQAAIDDDIHFLANSSNTGIFANLNIGNLAKGTYVLEVEGMATGPGNGMYGLGGYHADINLSPVPETTESPLLLSAIGQYGFIAARSRRNQDMTAS